MARNACHFSYCCFEIFYKIKSYSVCRNDPFDFIRCFRTLNFSDFHQSVKFGGFPFQIQLLPSLVFVDLSNKPQYFAIPFAITEFRIVKNTRSPISYFIRLILTYFRRIVKRLCVSHLKFIL